MWISNINSNCVPLSDSLIIAKAKKFGELIGVETKFKYSIGWLDRFKKRYGISAKTISGESASVDKSCINHLRDELKLITRKYNPNDVYNMDETALFFRMLPNKTLANRNTSGTKICKERLTIAVCANSTLKK